MRTTITILFFIFVSCSDVFSQNNLFISTRSWYMDSNNNVQGGEIIVELTILSLDSGNKAKISILKEMTPFSPVLELTTEAIWESDKYIFNCLDNFGNEAYGYFYFIMESIILFIDCKNFSDLGKNMARLYGETIILTQENKLN